MPIISDLEINTTARSPDSRHGMASLWDELLLQIFGHLEMTDLLYVQCTSKHLLRAARDAQPQKGKCFEKAPSVAQAFSSGDSLSELLNGLPLTRSASKVAISSNNVLMTL